MTLAERVAEILRSDIRLVAHPLSLCEDCGEPMTWKVKDGCIEKMSEKISELVFNAMDAGDISVIVQQSEKI